MTGIDQNAFWVPPQGDTIVVQTTVPGHGLAQWSLLLTNRTTVADLPLPNRQHGKEVTLQGHLIGAALVPGIQLQIDTQRKSIERLLEHLKQHCPELQGLGKCPHRGS